jgi:hypothetical protein
MLNFQLQRRNFEGLVSMVKRISISSIVDVIFPLSNLQKYERNLFRSTRNATKEMNSGETELQETSFD